MEGLIAQVYQRANAAHQSSVADHVCSSFRTRFWQEYNRRNLLSDIDLGSPLSQCFQDVLGSLPLDPFMALSCSVQSFRPSSLSSLFPSRTSRVDAEV